jgi:spore coat protein U-like protein
MQYQQSCFKGVLAGAILLAITTMGGTAVAGTASSNLPVSAIVSANCTIDASGGVAFGTYDPIVTNQSTALTASGTISTTCTNGASATITLGQGANADTGSTDTAPLRRMLAGTSDYLSYQLYSDSGYSTVWGNTAGTGMAVTGTGSAVSTTVYGSVAAGQNVKTGNYADTVAATVTF